MGSNQSLSATIEIKASPKAVRSVFLDLPQYNKWGKWTFEPADPTKSASDLKAGDGLKVNLNGMKFSPTIVENSTERLMWLGSLPYIFSGKHEFHFQPSQKTPGETTFTQLENFSGILAFMMAPGWGMRKSTLENWEGFNEDLKREVERRGTE